MKKQISFTLIAIAVTACAIWFTKSDTVDAQVSNVPIGSVIAWTGPKTKIPAGWLECDGRELNRNQFQDLFDAIGTTWGGTATDKFKVPDLRGYFLRGVDDGAKRDPDLAQRSPVGNGPVDSAGSLQGDAFRSHAHTFTIFDNGHSGNGNPGQDFPRNGRSSGTDPTGGNETRPMNAYVYFIIRAK